MKKKRLSLLVLLLAITSCSWNQPQTSPKTIRKTFFSNGNPLTLIEGAKIDEILRLKPDEISNLGSFFLSQVVTFEEKNLNTQETYEDAKKDQGPSITREQTLSQVLNRFLYSFKMTNDSKIYLSRTIIISEIDPKSLTDKVKKQIKEEDIRIISQDIIFKKVSGGYVFEKEVFRTNELVTHEIDSSEEDMIHISVSKDKSAISLLSKTIDSKKGVILKMTVFSKYIPGYPEVGSKKFMFSYGPGVKVKWNTKSKKEIHICGNQSKFLEHATKIALKSWQNPLGNLLNFQVKFKKTFRPFNDLNQNCIFYIKNYLVNSSNSFITPALNITIDDYYSGHIISSSTLFFDRAFRKLNSLNSSFRRELDFKLVTSQNFEYTEQRDINLKSKEQAQSSILYDKLFINTAIHEMGHFLGLHHIFDGTTSIMSYDNQPDKKLAEYDKNALRELYSSPKEKLSN